MSKCLDSEQARLARVIPMINKIGTLSKEITKEQSRIRTTLGHF